MRPRSEVRSIDLRSGMARPLLSGLKNAVAIDFLLGDSDEPGSDSVFWADVQDDKIYRGSLVGKTISNVQTVVENGVVGLEGLAVDWIGENLYWIVSDWDQIEVCDLGSGGGGGGVNRRTVVSGGMESPRSLALDPRAGLIFWTDWDAEAPRIESCDMSGRSKY